MAFAALIHKHRPDLIDFKSLDKKDALGNLTLALKVADEQVHCTSAGIHPVWYTARWSTSLNPPCFPPEVFCCADVFWAWR